MIFLQQVSVTLHRRLEIHFPPILEKNCPARSAAVSFETCFFLLFSVRWRGNFKIIDKLHVTKP